MTDEISDFLSLTTTQPSEKKGSYNRYIRPLSGIRYDKLFLAAEKSALMIVCLCLCSWIDKNHQDAVSFSILYHHKEVKANERRGKNS